MLQFTMITIAFMISMPLNSSESSTPLSYSPSLLFPQEDAQTVRAKSVTPTPENNDDTEKLRQELYYIRKKRREEGCSGFILPTFKSTEEPIESSKINNERSTVFSSNGNEKDKAAPKNTYTHFSSIAYVESHHSAQATSSIRLSPLPLIAATTQTSTFFRPSTNH